MMLLYVAFILLPAMVLATCDRPAFAALFTALDTDTSGNVTKAECEALFNIFDLNSDGNITLPEIKQQAAKYALQFVDHEANLLKFLDHTKDGVITRQDIAIDFLLADTNNDGFKTRPEFDSHVNWYCKQSICRCPRPCKG